ncbi:MAG: ABC transporter permease [Rheinheimera sp.]|nr:ABC transporter permease [Rheinheimera sp.]
MARLIAAQEQDFDALSEAFFFNLAALALLGYIVAAFLSFNAIKLSIAGRKKLLSQFAILGCAPSAIRTAIVLEFTLMSLLTALLGSLAGFMIANGLMFDINRTLMGLYQLEQALSISWNWQNLVARFSAESSHNGADAAHAKKYAEGEFQHAVLCRVRRGHCVDCLLVLARRC